MIQTAQNLIKKVSDMIVQQDFFGVYDPMQIHLHEINGHVHIAEIGIGRGRDEVHERENIFMCHMTNESDFAEDEFKLMRMPYTVNDLFNSHVSAGESVGSGNDDSICATATDFNELIMFGNCEWRATNDECVHGIVLFTYD